MTAPPSDRKIDWIGAAAKPLVLTAGLLPLVLLAWNAWHDQLGANPIAEITNATGVWTLRLLVLTLAVTPLRKLTGIGALGRFRRMLGLLSFLYAVIHFTAYIWLDKFFDFADMLDDVTKRKFIAVGFASFLLLVPLAATSFQRAQRWLGGRRWKLLHRLVYPAAVGGVVHFVWRVKADLSEPLVYALLVAGLLAARAWIALKSGPSS